MLKGPGSRKSEMDVDQKEAAKVFGTLGQNTSKSTSSDKTRDAAGWGWKGSTASFYLRYFSRGWFRGSSSMWKKMWTDVFFLLETLCQGVWVGFANSAVNTGVENFSLPKKDMPKQLLSSYSKILKCTIIIFNSDFSLMGHMILPYLHNILNIITMNNECFQKENVTTGHLWVCVLMVVWSWHSTILPS